MVNGVIVLSDDVRNKIEQMGMITLSRAQAGMVRVDDQLKVVPRK